MTIYNHTLRLALLLSLVLLLTACASAPPAATSTAPVAGPTSGEGATVTIDQPIVEIPSSGDRSGRGGSGSFDLLDPTVGLDALATYGATLHTTFDGTQAGEPTHWDRTYTFAQTDTRLMSIEAAGEAESGSLLGDIGAVSYRYQPESLCEFGEVVEDQQTAWEPARALPVVIGASEGGAEQVNGIAAVRYDFDQSATTYASGVTASGTVWIAEQGGYVLRYTLTVEGPIGDGVEGQLTWDYSLAPDAPPAIAIPAACPLPLNAPLMPDASAVTHVPGMTTYITSGTPEEVLAFYQEALTAQGWSAAGEPVQIEGAASLNLSQGDQTFTVIARSQPEGGTRVILRAATAVTAP